MTQKKTITSILLTLAILTGIILFFTRCAASRITDARPAVLVNSEKVKRSTNYLVCIQDKDGIRYSAYWNSHCWTCQSSAIPTEWNVVTLKNGKVLIEPVK